MLADNPAMNDLLAHILANNTAADGSEQTVWVRSTADLLHVAHYGESNPEESAPKTTRERYFYGVFREQLKELTFYYKQTILMQAGDYSPEEKTLIQHRLKVILDAIAESFAETRTYFWKLITSPNETETEAAVFALSCFARDSDAHKDSSLLFETFAGCSIENLTLFVSAFKNSLNKDMHRKVLQVLNSSNRSEIKTACKTIIDHGTESTAFSTCRSTI